MHNWKVLAHTYLSGAWHYRWLAMAVTWIVCLLGWGALAAVPNQFQAVAKIYVDTDTMMAPLLRGLTVSTDPDQQVSVMLNTLLTRPNLEQVVRLTAPQGTNISTPDMAREVARLQQSISLRPLGTKNLYEISYTNKDPNKALSVSQSLLSIFVDSNIGTGHRALQGATAFLDDKVAEYETLVREAEQRRAAFRQANLDVLSDAVTPEQARAQVEKARQDLGAAQARYGSLRAQLAGIPKIIFIDGPGPLILGSADGSGRSGSILQRLSEAKQGLIDLRSRYTDDHPDVKAAMRRVAQLQAEAAATPLANPQGTGNQSISNPVYVQTQSKLSDAMTEVAFEQHKLSDAMQAMENSKKMTGRAIEISTKFADLDRDYDLVHKTYQELLTRRKSARISQSVNDQQSAVTVRIVEPPRKAPFPVAPNRPLINTLILLAGIGAGLATAVGMAVSAGRFYAKEQLAFFDYPIIGVVSRLPQLDDVFAARSAYMALGGALLILMASYIGVLLILDATFRGTLRGLLMTDKPVEPLNLVERIAKRLAAEQVPVPSPEPGPVNDSLIERAAKRVSHDEQARPSQNNNREVHAAAVPVGPAITERNQAPNRVSTHRNDTVIPARPGRQVHLDFRALRQNGMITPDNMASSLSNEFRGIKRKLLQKVRDPKTRARGQQLDHGHELAARAKARPFPPSTWR